MAAQDATPPPEEALPDPALATVDQAGFSPFASVGTVVQGPAPAPPRPPDGDWAVPVVVTVLGLACIGLLLRRLLS